MSESTLKPLPEQKLHNLRTFQKVAARVGTRILLDVERLLSEGRMTPFQASKILREVSGAIDVSARPTKKPGEKPGKTDTSKPEPDSDIQSLIDTELSEKES